VNERLLQRLDGQQVDLILRKIEQAEVDEMWSYAIDHHTGQVLAYAFGTREDDVYVELQALLAPFGITRFYTDGWGAYRRHIDPDKHTVGK
jgi:insertion element IS1 protein InsB